MVDIHWFDLLRAVYNGTTISGDSLMSEVIALAEKLRSEGEKMVAVFAGLSEEQWQKEIYTEGTTWTIRNMLSHLVTSERGLLKLFEKIRQGDSGSPDDFSIDRYNAAMQARTQALTPQELLEQYKTIRAESVAWTSGLSEDDLKRQGRHPYLGITTIREMIKMLYIHNLDHSRDMKKALRD
jgi:uncharacterized damage-inducible protein DinB